MCSKKTPSRGVGRLLRWFSDESRRGVASVLAMMFLILFGSLVAAMATVSTGNIKTAKVHPEVMRAMSAAETGMAVAEHRLNEAASRFIVSKSKMDADMSWALWTGDSGTIGSYTVAPPFDGYAEGSLPAGIAQALVNVHAADANIITGLSFIEDPEINSAPGGVDSSVYESTYWVNTPAVLIESWADQSNTNPPPAFQIRYAPLEGGRYIRVISEGIVYDFSRNSAPIRRTITRDFAVAKTVDQAIIAHSKILIGKNVMINGDIGARFDEVDFEFGDPIVMRSDFIGLDPDLDTKITLFWMALAIADVDLDGLPGPDGAFNDATSDGYLDEMDIFIRHYDVDGDNRVTLSQALIDGTQAGIDLRTPEFVGAGGVGIDEDLALLIDGALPDRNKNGVYGFVDNDGNQKYDPLVDDPADWDQIHSLYSDEELGWRDGYIDVMDQYAKITGSLTFRANASAWEAAQGPIGGRLRGPINPDDDDSPLTFDADDIELPDINSASFVDTENALIAAADGDPFWQQVSTQLGTDIASLSTWTLGQNPADSSLPQLTPVWDDANFDGVPDNSAWAYFEKAPFNSPSYSDVYWRPVFENFVFRNVQIPMGLNGLFINCTFVGSTYVRTNSQNTHPLWQEYGVNQFDVDGLPTPKYPRYVYGDNAGEDADNAPPMLPP
ncbi:MAG: hypothetical protein JKY96_03120, partial [Phycisphaerales bacterium]|nr:hypothetical protein [Phycisphaerales bacterium]